MMKTPHECDMCDKPAGLPILLTRYAVALNSSGAAKLNGAFKPVPYISLGPSADYALRLLRGGYVYLYNPADKEEPWRGYLVTEEGYLDPFRIPAGGPTDESIKPDYVAPCIPTVFGATAQFITIEHAEEAGDIWIGYSNVQWTHAVWKRYNANEEGCRDKTMRKINVKAWLDSSKAQHAGLLKDSIDMVVEFDARVERSHFLFSIEPIASRAKWIYYKWDKIAAELGVPRPANPDHPTEKEISQIIIGPGNRVRPGIEEAKAKHNISKSEQFLSTADHLTRNSPKSQGKGMVLAIDDVVGITGDLAALMSNRKDVFDQEPKRIREVVTSATIEGLRNTIRVTAANDVWVSYERSDYTPNMPPDILEMMDRAANREWGKYENSLGPGKLEAFYKKYHEELMKFNEGEIVSLSKAQAQWLMSAALVDALDFACDGNNIDSGLAYAESVSICMGASQDKIEVLTVFEQWVREDISKRENLYLRALVLGQEKAFESIKKFLTNTQGKDFEVQRPFWEDFLYTSVLRNLKDAAAHNANTTLSRLLGQGGNAIVNLARTSALRAQESGRDLERLIAILSFLCGYPLGTVRVTVQPGGMLNFAGNRIHQILQRTGAGDVNFHRNMLGASVMNASDDVQRNIGASLLVDMDALERELDRRLVSREGRPLTGSARKSGAIAALNRSIVSVDRAFDSMTESGSGRVANATPLVSSTVGGLVCIISAHSAWNAYEQYTARTPELQNTYMVWQLGLRFAAGFVASSAMIAEFAAAAIEMLQQRNILTHQWWGKGAAFLKGTAKRLGFGAVAGWAMLDAADAEDARRKGHFGLMWANAASAVVVGVPASWLVYQTTLSSVAMRAALQGLSVTSVTIGGLTISVLGMTCFLFALGVAIALWVASEKREANLKEWLDRSLFGNQKTGPVYSSLDVELAALKEVY